ncbi:alkylation response protein AidB-like acyl-CoA dehydrogenase [Sphingobium jiangsuense]|uniref:Alkylation response protein AidB-like acyl-CoA dehydrogenase n=2 Tax=Sphingomonadaceae TaxID=41297 RepID=A0A7W6BVV4_9SPHN|nr:alkylation response protein AidB-like acyl-CoA dehydrogenase [Sphingobium jiangsuense]
MSSEERVLLVGSVRRLLGDEWTTDRAVTMSSDPAELRRINSELCELGLAELGAPEGPGLRETLLVCEELGRASCHTPLIATFLCNRLFSGFDDPVTRSFIADVRSGKAIPTVALSGFDGDFAAGAARWADGRLLGRTAFVEGLTASTHVLVLTSAPFGIAIVMLDGHGVRVTPTPALSIAPLGELELDCRPVAWHPFDEKSLADAATIARLAATSRAEGAAQRAFDLALEYAKIRRQFGHVIGEFQAIQHKLANCLVQLDGTRLGLGKTADAYDRGDAGWRMLADAAIAFAGPALRQLILEVHHALGAIGYSEEHEAPRHFRSVHADLARFGGAQRARSALADQLLSKGAKLPSHDTSERVIEFRKSIREWLDANWTAAEREANRKKPLLYRRWQPEFARKMGEAGWLGLDWPKELGGQARAADEQLAFIEELEFCEAPSETYMVAETIIGPAIIKFGSDEQKRQFLPAMLRGDDESMFALHYSEPEAGSDLASLRTMARRDGEEWVVSGQKLWTTNGELAKYAILAARTDPEAKPKHAGISTFLVRLDTPGIDIRPIKAMYGRTFCATFYDDVRIPASALLGPENGGWQVITSALAAERVTIGSVAAHLQKILYRLIDHLITADNDRAKDPVIRDRIGGLAADLEIARQFALRNAELVQAERVPIYEAAISKMFIGDLHERFGEAALDLLGSGGLLSEDCPSAPLGEMEQELRYSIMTAIGGGTGEMQRNTIALRGLGLPRMK